MPSLTAADDRSSADLLGGAVSIVEMEFFFFKNEGSFLIWTVERGQFCRLNNTLGKSGGSKGPKKGRKE